jgi:hypothetical protein
MDDDFERRKKQLMRRPIAKEQDPEYLEDKLTSATAAWHEITRRTIDLGEVVDGVIVDYAVALINREGAEGSSAASEGGVSRTFSLDDIEKRMRANKVIPGLGA